MTSKTKTAFIVAAALFGTGALIFLLSSMSVGFDFSRLSLGFHRSEGGEFVQNAPEGRTLVEHAIDSKDQEILLDIVSDNIKVSPSEDGKIYLSYYNSETLYYDFQETDRYISLAQKGKTSFQLGWSIQADYPVTLRLPKNYGGPLSLRSTSGDCELRGISLNKALGLGTVSGNVYLEDCAADSLSVSTVSGDQQLKDFKAQSLAASSVSGNLRIREYESKRPLSLSTTSGDIHLEDLSLTEADIGTVSGNIHLTEISGARAELNTTSGDASLAETDFKELIFSSLSGDLRGSVKGKASDYTAFTSTLSGSNSLSGHREKGEKTLDFSSTSGSFSLSFGG